MEVFKRPAGYVLLEQKKKLDELGIESIENKIQKFKSNWPNFVSSVGNARISKLLYLTIQEDM